MRKISSTRKGLKLIFGAAALHLFGVIITFFWGGKKLVDTEFNLFFHLLRFFSWWSVHTSILTVWAAIIIGKERKKKTTSYFSQFITFLAALYNLITFFFWNYCLLFLSVGWEKSWFLNGQLVAWHFVAPLTTVFYFFFYTQTNLLRKKLTKTLFFSSLSPVFYFFYVYILAKINRPTSSLFPYMEKYPYFIFEWITNREWKQFIFNFLISCLVFLAITSLVIWIKSIYEKRKNRGFGK